MPTQIQHTSIYLPKDLHTSLRVASLNLGFTMSELIVRSLEGSWNLTSKQSPNGLVRGQTDERGKHETC